MARFEEGNTIGEATRINGEVAAAMQAKAAEARKRNRTLRETLLTALNEDGGGGMTRLEHLVRKAMENHRKGKLTFHDLKDLSCVLGETTINLAGTEEGQALGIRIIDTRKPSPGEYHPDDGQGPETAPEGAKTDD